jgi:hypothetical protein
MVDRRILRFLPLVIVALFAASCSSSGYDDRGTPRGRPDYGSTSGEGRPEGGRAAMAGLDMMPPQDWWHDDTIARPVNLSTDQLQALDRIGHDEGETIARMERDSIVAVRDLRDRLDADHPATDDIVSAGQRLRSMRDELFDRQVRMVADERQVLTTAQWRTLQDQLQAARRGRRGNDNGSPRRGGRGYPGRGTGRGFPG